jgi:DNA-binding transcriptional MerR regulator
MSAVARFLNPSEAAKRLGISAKALRLYEQRGLVAPGRTAAGWRAYGPDEMARAAEIVALRELGLSLAQIAEVLGGASQSLMRALAAHQTTLEGRIRELGETIERVRNLRAGLVQGQLPTAGDLTQSMKTAPGLSVAFELPWPWGGEQFELNDIRALNYIIGPLGSGKTRLAMRLAETLPDAAFLGLDRLADAGVALQARLDADPALKSRVDQTLAWLLDDGATVSEALTVLVVALESEEPAILIVDMVEEGLDQATQEALIVYLRQYASRSRRPLFLMTRSSAILDLAAVGSDEAIIFCPANHSPPTPVTPYLGAPGYEAVATCLASPEVRKRTQGVIAWRPASDKHNEYVPPLL